jgi:ribonucleoside-triphosphate reductase
MLIHVIKRDHRKKPFDTKHIYDAIEAAFKDCTTQYTNEILDGLVGEVVDDLSAGGRKSAKVEDIQDTIENVLMDSGYNCVAKAFIKYRQDRARIRENESGVYAIIRKLKHDKMGSANILKDNANESGMTPAGMYGKIASETNKLYNCLNSMSRKYSEEHADGIMHIHDLNFYDLSFNCLFAPIGKLLNSGFDSGTGFLRRAKSIQSAAALTAVILQLQSNQQYGGIAADNIDFDLAPFVDESFRKNLARELNRYAMYSHDQEYEMFLKHHAETEEMMIKRIAKKLAEIGITMDLPLADLYNVYRPECVATAIECTDIDTHQAMEALVHNLNSLQSRSGNQVPFSSLNFGMDTSNCGRMVSKNLMRAQYEGMGDGLTAIFPILIFKLMKGYTKYAGDPNFDLYNQAIECLARRFYPNFVRVDSSFNKPYIKYETKEVELSGGKLISHRGNNDSVMITDETDIETPKGEFPEYSVNLGIGDNWDIIKCKGHQATLRRVIPNTTIATMGCRTRVIGNINGAQQTTGRGNFAFHTINLPRLAIEAHLESTNVENRKKIFYEKLDAILEDAKGSLLERFKLICEKTYENYPFTMQQGVYYTSDDKPHDVNDKIADVLKQSTLSIGYIGIAETVKVITGKTFGIDHDVDDFAIDIVKHIREFTDACQKETHFNWSTFATPAEAVAGRFATIDKNKFAREVKDEDGHTMLVAKNKKLADVDLQRLFGKGYYTNSHMMDFSLNTSLDNKIKTEAPFHALTNAGHIFYYKLNGDLTKNTAAVKACIDAMYEGDLGYFTCTMDSDDCLKCGFHGIINNCCPKCGCSDENYFVRVRRITGYLTGSPRKSIINSWNDGKIKELGDRNNI